MVNALVGYTGFVGSTLQKQTSFGALFRSTNVTELAGQHFDTLVCAGAPAQKWLANKEPAQDRASLDLLMRSLETVQCRTFILISTVDVFASPVGVDEGTPVVEEGLHPYGLHRRLLEKFVEARFPRRLVARLPGLVGPGLRKNVIYDFHHHNNLTAVESRAVFQFYPMVNLWFDLQTALKAELSLVHLTAEPVQVSRVASEGFGLAFDRVLDGRPAAYDFRTQHAERFGGRGAYQYSARETLQAVRAYAQSEPKR